MPGRMPGTFVPIAAALLPICTGGAWAQTSSDSDALTVIDVLIMVAVTIYFLPTIVAFVRSHPNRWPILIINTVFGLTILGWFGSLIWAFGAVHLSPTGNHGGESGLNLFVNDPARRETVVAGPISATPLPDDPADELRRLKALHDAGALDEAEYQRLRAARSTASPADTRHLAPPSDMPTAPHSCPLARFDRRSGIALPETTSARVMAATSQTAGFAFRSPGSATATSSSPAERPTDNDGQWPASTSGTHKGTSSLANPWRASANLSALSDGGRLISCVRVTGRVRLVGQHRRWIDRTESADGDKHLRVSAASMASRQNGISPSRTTWDRSASMCSPVGQASSP